MGWIYTLLASLGELVMVWGLKQPSRLTALISIVLSALITGFFLNRGLQLLDSSSVYPLWVSIGSIGALLMGALFYDERLNRQQFGWVLMLLIGCIGLVAGG